MNEKLKRSGIVVGISLFVILLSVLAFKLLYPFLLALIFAAFINPIVHLICKYTKIPRGLSVFLTMLILVGGILFLIAFSAIEIVAAIQYLLKMIPIKSDGMSDLITLNVNTRLLPFFEELSKIYNNFSSDDQHRILTKIENTKNEAINFSVDALRVFLYSILNFIQNIPSLATAFIFGLLGTFFICKDWYVLKEKVNQRIPDKIGLKAKNLFSGLKEALYGFVKAQVVIVAITCVSLSIGMLILQLNNAILIGILIGLIDFIPYVGIGLIIVPWLIYELIIGNYFLGYGLLILYAIVIVIRQLIEPKILSSNIGLNTLATIISMYCGVKLFGLFGLVVGPVTLVIIMTCIRTHIFADVWHYIQNGSTNKIDS